MVKFFGVGEEDNEDKVQTDILKKIESDNEVGQVAVDIIETNNEIIIFAPIAGIDLEDIDLSFNKSILTISGNREKPDIFNSEAIVKNSECFWGKFVRNIILPENLDFDSIKATMENNLLIITIKLLTFSAKEIKIDRIES